MKYLLSAIFILFLTSCASQKEAQDDDATCKNERWIEKETYSQYDSKPEDRIQVYRKICDD